MTATVVDGRWVFAGAEPLPDSRPDCGLIELVRSLLDQGWELDPRSAGGTPIRLRRRRPSVGAARNAA